MTIREQANSRQTFVRYVYFFSLAWKITEEKKLENILGKPWEESMTSNVDEKIGNTKTNPYMQCMNSDSIISEYLSEGDT